MRDQDIGGPRVRRLPIRAVIVIALVAVVVGCCWLPVVDPDPYFGLGFNAQPGQADSWRDPRYGLIIQSELRRAERRSVYDLVRHYRSAIVVYHTERGLVVERISSRSADEGWFAEIHHVELAPEDVPAAILSGPERATHRADFRRRGGAARPYTDPAFSV